MCPSHLFYEHGESFNMHRRTEIGGGVGRHRAKVFEKDGIDPAGGQPRQPRQPGAQIATTRREQIWGGWGEERSILDALPHWQSCVQATTQCND